MSWQAPGKPRRRRDQASTAVSGEKSGLSKRDLAQAAADPRLRVLPVAADFTQPFALSPGLSPAARRLGFFPGSTIGNFEPDAAAGFLSMARRVLGRGAHLLIGADLVEERAVLEAACDDAQGVTARFNLNLLARLNRECGADFVLSAFRHSAVWNEGAERIEMHLLSLRAQAATLAAQRIHFAPGETIHTENSHKVRREGFQALCQRAGWRIERSWSDPGHLFSVWLLRCPQGLSLDGRGT
ncbi:MAG TPA: L-histidine N(alpha)-methyltransferase [Acetobacteraceae bacterium]|nr:L-histidine N(alpha)-methyltransferase [Acetobacteraceae bacterium]